MKRVNTILEINKSCNHAKQGDWIDEVFDRQGPTTNLKGHMTFFMTVHKAIGKILIDALKDTNNDNDETNNDNDEGFMKFAETTIKQLKEGLDEDSSKRLEALLTSDVTREKIAEHNKEHENPYYHTCATIKSLLLYIIRREYVETVRTGGKKKTITKTKNFKDLSTKTDIPEETLEKMYDTIRESAATKQNRTTKGAEQR